ncbi:MAG: cytochrome c biogenesis protein CcdC [Paenibacillaceae bacterium]
MLHSIRSILPITSTIGMTIMALMVIFLRLRNTKKPMSIRKIIIPPIGMCSGFFMFIYPPMRFPIQWGLIDFAAGAIFLSLPLILTSKFEQVGNDIYLRRSKAFIVILLTILIIRFSLHSFVEEWVSIFQTAALFFVLAFGMLIPWRVAMYFQYIRLRRG